MASSIATGTVLAGFRLDSVIGEGAMGTVYLAEDTKGGGRVALKLLAPELARDERFRRRFLRETELAASLDHPHVVPTLASGEGDGILYLAMAYVEGSDLRELLRRDGRLEPERAIELIAQVAEALDAAHATGLVHRDVKPGNILVKARPAGEHAYVCDFGLARHVSSVSSLTGDRGFVGTIDYVPPEQIEGGTIDGRADVYSLGCVLYECLAGARPFDRDSELSVVFAHLNEPPPRLTDRRPEVPDAFDGVFETALAKSPGDRYSTCGELADAARAALQGKTFARRKSRRRRYVIAAAAALVAAGAAVGGFLVSGTNQARATPSITQTAIAGARLGHMPAYYKKLLGGWRAQRLTEPGFPSLAFQQPEVAVYFPAKEKPAHIITTWNRHDRTAGGIGPCSTIRQMKKVYGARIKPTWAGNTHNGKQWSYALGKNLLFATQDQRTIADVTLYRGDPRNTRGGSPQSWANYVASVETACK
jgi:predicted Ser/Thr protein kinase